MHGDHAIYLTQSTCTGQYPTIRLCNPTNKHQYCMIMREIQPLSIYQIVITLLVLYGTVHFIVRTLH